MRKTALLAAAAIALLAAAGIAAILLLGKEPAPGGPAAPPPPPEASHPPSPSAAAPAPAPTSPPQQPQAPAGDLRPAVPGPPAPERRPVDPTPALAWFGREAHLALRPFADRISTCARGERPPGPTKMVVRLERLQGRVRVLGVQAERGRPGSAALERCARAELVGRELAVPGSLPGPPTRVAMPVR